MSLIDNVKEFLRIDDNNDGTLIVTLVSAAEIYLTNAGVKKDETNDLYCLAVNMLVSHWYDNRSAVIIGTISKSLEYSLQSILTQLKFCYPTPTV